MSVRGLILRPETKASGGAGVRAKSELIIYRTEVQWYCRMAVPKRLLYPAMGIYGVGTLGMYTYIRSNQPDV